MHTFNCPPFLVHITDPTETVLAVLVLQQHCEIKTAMQLCIVMAGRLPVLPLEGTAFVSYYHVLLLPWLSLPSFLRTNESVVEIFIGTVLESHVLDNHGSKMIQCCQGTPPSMYRSGL